MVGWARNASGDARCQTSLTRDHRTRSRWLRHSSNSNLGSETEELHLEPEWHTGQNAKTLVKYANVRVVLTAMQAHKRTPEHQTEGRISDLIVLGRGDRTRLVSLSQLREVLRKAPCPVLIVHPAGHAAVA